jgi:hypothetical protein
MGMTSQDEAAQIARIVRSVGYWTGALTASEIDSLRRLGCQVQIHDISPDGSAWDCEVREEEKDRR